MSAPVNASEAGTVSVAGTLAGGVRTALQWTLIPVLLHFFSFHSPNLSAFSSACSAKFDFVFFLETEAVAGNIGCWGACGQHRRVRPSALSFTL
eukprot:3094964-Rhodomonas_salina.1